MTTKLDTHPEPKVFKLRKNQGRVFLDQHRFIVLVAGRRWAKTTTTLIKLFKAAYEKPGLYGYFAPTYGQAKLIAWEILKSLIPPSYRSGLPNETELHIKLNNGSIIRLFGLDRPERILGIKLAGAVLDEYDQTKPNVYEQYIRPALSDSMGFCWFSGNPDSTKRKLKNLYDDVRINEREDWVAFHYKSIDGGYIPEEEIEAAKRDLDPRTFREQYEASFEDITGQVYYAFDPKVNIQANDTFGVPVTYNPNLPLRICWDFNVNPFCVTVAQTLDRFDEFRNRYTDVHVVDEFVINNSNTPEMCRTIAEKYQNHNSGVMIYGDASGNSRHTSSSLSDYTIITEAFRPFPHFSMRVPAANPHVKDRINAVNSKLRSYDGKSHLWIKPGLKALPKDLMNVTYKESTCELDKSDPDLTHISDALGYLVSYEWPINKGYIR